MSITGGERNCRSLAFLLSLFGVLVGLLLGEDSPEAGLLIELELMLERIPLREN
jgi:hypothetical protein